MTTPATSAFALNAVECSDQPLDLAFHPTRPNILAAALVDGTLEVHDITTDNKGPGKADVEDDDGDENDTILSSIQVHNESRKQQPAKSSRADDDKNDGDDPTSSLKRRTSSSSCRAVLFDSFTGGNQLYTGGSAGELVVLDAEQACSFSVSNEKAILWRGYSNALLQTTTEATADPLHILHQLPPCAPTGPVIVSGDEGGGICLWDVRCSSPLTGGNSSSSNVASQAAGVVWSWQDCCKDYISGLDHSDDGNTLLATSADGTLNVLDVRKCHSQRRRTTKDFASSNTKAASCLIRKSDEQDDELLSIRIMKHGRKVVCGTQDGVVAVWSWGTWGDVSDRFPGNPASIDAMLKIDEDTLLTGSSDGLLRVVQIHPDRFLGVLGDHDGFPIEKLQFNSNRDVVGSVSHDNFIRLWDARVLRDDWEGGADDDKEEDDDDKDDHKKNDLQARLRGTGSAAVKEKEDVNDNDEDDDDEDDEEEDDSENEEEDEKDGGKKHKKGDDSDDDEDDDDGSDDDDDDSDDGKNNTINVMRAKRFKSDSEKFFADL